MSITRFGIQNSVGKLFVRKTLINSILTRTLMNYNQYITYIPTENIVYDILLLDTILLSFVCFEIFF